MEKKFYDKISENEKDDIINNVYIFEFFMVLSACH